MPRRAKAVRRPKLRSEIERGPLSLRQKIRLRFQSVEAMFFATYEFSAFFAALDTADQRLAFQQEFPRQFFNLFGFFSHASDEWPASTQHEFRVFRRPADEFLEMLERQPPRTVFVPPDVTGLHFFPEQFEALAVARGRWWRANGWPMTARERGFLADNEKEN